MLIEESEEKRMKETKNLDFIDERGNENIITLEGKEKITLPNKNYKLQHESTSKKINHKLAKGIFTSDIGVHSNGFAGIMGLALIVAVAGIIVAYLVLRF